MNNKYHSRFNEILSNHGNSAVYVSFFIADENKLLSSIREFC